MKIVLQDGTKDCGVCCLLSVTRYYGGEISKELLREITNTSKIGVSAYNLIEAAKKIGFTAVGVEGDLLKIEKNNLPCLAHVVINNSYKHFVVIYDIDIDKKRVLVMDPAKGKRSLSIAEFKLMSSSKYILLKPYKQLPVMSQKKIIVKVMREFIFKYKAMILMILLLSMILFSFQIITSFHFKYLLEFSLKYHLTKPIILISTVLLLIYIFRELASLLRGILIIKCSNLMDSLITFKTYNHILLLPYLYYKNRTTGEVISRFKDLNTVKSFLIEACCFFVTDFISLIVFSFVLFRLNKRLFLLIFLFSIVMLMCQIVFDRINKKYISRVKFSSDLVNSDLVQALSSAETLKNRHLEKRLFDVFALKYKKLLERNYSLVFFSNCFSNYKHIIDDLLVTIILGYGSYLVVISKISLGNLLVYQSVFNYFLLSFNGLLTFIGSFTDFKLAYERIEELFTIDCEKFNGNYYYSFCKLVGEIRFNNLSYTAYSKVLFTNLSFEISCGERILLTGSSGSGKSTLMKILMRYIEVPFGYVSINNIDINHYHLDVIRRNIVYVSSLETLFTDTIYNNIVLGRDIAKDKFLEIAEITGVDDIISKDLGYQQLLEENGSNLSNGERQRIILARSLVNDGDIYIFDEVFSQIDSEKTKLIMRKMFTYLSGKTVIVISHRFSENKLFNRILKLKDGKISEIKKL